MDRLKLASLGERIKIGGSQMGRMVSEKFKDLVQTPTPELKMVDEATLETMEEPNWGMNLRICAMLNSEEFSGSEIVRAIKKKISGKSVVSQRLSLDLLEACAMNCEKVFSEVASEKVLDEMVRMIDNPQTENNNRDMALQLIRAWGESEDLAYLPVFHQTYMGLRQRSIPPPVQGGNTSSIPYSLDPFVDQQPLSPPNGYPFPETAFHGTDDSYVPYNYDSQTIEEKKEFLSVARNSLELFSSILNSETEPKAIQDDLMVSMVEKCKQSQPGVQRIVETTVDDEVMLFNALTLHDELQQVISRYEEIKAALKNDEPVLENPMTTPHSNPSHHLETHQEKPNVLTNSPTEYISESSSNKKSMDEEK